MSEKSSDDEVLAGASEVLIDELKKQGTQGFLLIGVKQVGDKEADVWCRLSCTAVQAGNMIAYALASIENDTAIAAVIKILTTHPLIAPRLAAALQKPWPLRGTADSDPDPQEPAKKEYVN